MAKTKTKNTTISKKKDRRVKHGFYAGLVAGTDPLVVKKDPPKEDPEKILPDHDEELAGLAEKFDEDKLQEIPYAKYPPPKKNPKFRKKWRLFIDVVATNKGFKEVHLEQLEILCDLYVEYEELSAFLRVNGYTYEAFGRQGRQCKPFPEVAQRNRVLGEIRNYSKVLGISLTRDESAGASKGDDWS